MFMDSVSSDFSFLPGFSRPPLAGNTDGPAAFHQAGRDAWRIVIAATLGR